MFKTPRSIRAYRERVRALEKMVSAPTKIVVVLGALLIVPTVGLVGEGVRGSTALKVLSVSIPTYLVVTASMWGVLFGWKGSLESVKVTRGLLMGFFLADLYFLSLWLYTGEQPLESKLFWVYCLLIVRNVIYFPEVFWQVVLTVVTMLCYGGTLVANRTVGKEIFSAGNIDALGLRFLIMALVSVSAWGVYAMYQRRQEMEDEMQEMTIRSERLNLAGLVAKETAHSLKNPLAIMNNACFLLGREVGEGQPKVKEHVEILRNQIDRADGIIGELTKYSELADGRIEKADVNEGIRRCLKDLEYEIRERGIDVRLALYEDLPMLMIERTQLGQVLSNILLNACQAIGKKGTIHVRTGIEEDGRIRIEVEDTGCGIAEENLHDIFKASYTTKERGSGIGLSIAHAVVQAFSGTIGVESKVGRGTKFTILLPIRTERVE